MPPEPTCVESVEGAACTEDRLLSEEELEKLKYQDNSLVPEFKQLKLETEAKKNWDLFYKRNDTRFFRDRHWTTREFEQLAELGVKEGFRNLLEVGCGVGNFLFPLLEENRSFFIYACDFSPRAVEFVKGDPRYRDDRVKVFTCDVTKEK